MAANSSQVAGSGQVAGEDSSWTDAPLASTVCKSLEGEFRRNWRPVKEEKLRVAIRDASIVLGADFHAYSQSQRAHIRILRDHVPGEKQVILALECVGREDEAAIHAYLMGRLSENKFLAGVDWDSKWGFPWEHYRPIFELARDRGYSVRGLNNSRIKDLARRDQWTAQRLLEMSSENPQALVYAVIGEWHLASSHLPKRLNRGLRRPSELVVLFQDIESLYFRFAEKSKEAVELLAGSGNRFCLMVSPPWMKWQSYLMYLEQAYDRDLQEELAIDYSDHVVSLIELLESDLKIETHKIRVQVYCPNSQTPLRRLRLSLPRRFDKALVYHLEHDLSFYIPEKDWLYLRGPRSIMRRRWRASSCMRILVGGIKRFGICRRTSSLKYGLRRWAFFSASGSIPSARPKPWIRYACNLRLVTPRITDARPCFWRWTIA
ncbi:MAG: ChaN family lipoprotein [Calothrix sp. SM1_5_4]|nr:ChaN family lipoprotein [Calothrix sp. SM1_5_4]